MATWKQLEERGSSTTVMGTITCIRKKCKPISATLPLGSWCSQVGTILTNMRYSSDPNGNYVLDFVLVQKNIEEDFLGFYYHTGEEFDLVFIPINLTNSEMRQVGTYWAAMLSDPESWKQIEENCYLPPVPKKRVPENTGVK